MGGYLFLYDWLMADTDTFIQFKVKKDSASKSHHLLSLSIFVHRFFSYSYLYYYYYYYLCHCLALPCFSPNSHFASLIISIISSHRYVLHLGSPIFIRDQHSLYSVHPAFKIINALH